MRSAQSTLPESRGVRPRSLNGRRILIVEDEYFIADDISRGLARLGATVIGPVATCQEALTLLDEQPAPNFVLLDINVLDEAAFPVADALQERGIPFVFTT